MICYNLQIQDFYTSIISSPMPNIKFNFKSLTPNFEHNESCQYIFMYNVHVFINIFIEIWADLLIKSNNVKCSIFQFTTE